MKKDRYRLVKINIHGQKQYVFKGWEPRVFDSLEEANKYIKEKEGLEREYHLEKFETEII